MSILGDRTTLRAYRNQHDSDVALFRDILQHWQVPEIFTDDYDVWIRLRERVAEDDES